MRGGGFWRSSWIPEGVGFEEGQLPWWLYSFEKESQLRSDAPGDMVW